tara:strand:- start:49588 stop:49923 length:336 start_codon:yes stop_codon:yes gene_type:complete
MYQFQSSNALHQLAGAEPRLRQCMQSRSAPAGVILSGANDIHPISTIRVKVAVAKKRREQNRTNQKDGETNVPLHLEVEQEFANEVTGNEQPNKMSHPTSPSRTERYNKSG